VIFRCQRPVTELVRPVIELVEIQTGGLGFDGLNRRGLVSTGSVSTGSTTGLGFDGLGFDGLNHRGTRALPPDGGECLHDQ